ncbi:MAG: type IV toxin-antitoxin system AbiEi family antitoxin domain-containing protein [Actinobacteria bacterium]|nr:type IV toxin-antitoxin system AbiEi family antitoxin domain-containing protein [Actinomycetota bacterium]
MLGAGLSRARIRTMVQRGELIKLSRGVYIASELADRMRILPAADRRSAPRQLWQCLVREPLSVTARLPNCTDWISSAGESSSSSPARQAPVADLPGSPTWWSMLHSCQQTKSGGSLAFR